MNVFINVKPIDGPWGGGNLMIQAFHRFIDSHQGLNLVYSLHQNPDIIIVINLESQDYEVSINDIIDYVERNPETYVIHRVNDCDARKSTNHMDSLVCGFSPWADLTVFVSNWMKSYYLTKENWSGNNYEVIYNGVDRNVFVEQEKKNNSKINIVTHHWSNNIMKGFDIYEFIDSWVSDNKDYTFTYIGRHNGTFKNSLIIDPIYGKALGNELGKYDLYVSGSLHDPGPNHILEALSCNIPTYVHKDGGGAREFAGEEYVYNDISELDLILRQKTHKMNSVDFLISWEECVNTYFEFIFGDL